MAAYFLDSTMREARASLHEANSAGARVTMHLEKSRTVKREIKRKRNTEVSNAIVKGLKFMC